jgi:hypothetical protein
MKITVTWDVAPCSLVETDRQSRGAYCIALITGNIPEDSHLYTALMMEAVSISETVKRTCVDKNFKEGWCDISESSIMAFAEEDHTIDS